MESIVDETIKALRTKGYKAWLVKNKEEALKKIKEVIPAGVSVMNGSSTTLQEIGYIDYLKSGLHLWKNWHEKILMEKDQEKQNVLRQEATMADYYLGSVHALIKNGEFVVASNTGSQLPHIVYTSPNLIFVVSAKKIVVNLEEAFQRTEKVVVPLEDERLRRLYGVNTQLNKMLIFKGENQNLGRKVNFILVEEDLGF